MKTCTRMLCTLVAAASLPMHATPVEWSQPRQPFRIHGNTWYVGTRGLSAVLITSPQGHVLIDGTLEGNAGQIEANIRQLGFRLEDVRVILNSHAHGDHAGAIAKLAQDSGATVHASAAGAVALRSGGDDPDDPQHGEGLGFPPVAHVAVIGDGQTLRVGPLALVAHYTPGHTPGSTSWTWQSCEQGHCLDIAYPDSLTAISSDGFRFSDDAAHPHRVEDFRQSFATVAGLPCDILITPHPEASGFMERVARRDHTGDAAALQQPGACRDYAEAARKLFDKRLEQERRERP